MVPFWKRKHLHVSRYVPAAGFICSSAELEQLASTSWLLSDFKLGIEAVPRCQGTSVKERITSALTLSIELSSLSVLATCYPASYQLSIDFLRENKNYALLPLVHTPPFLCLMHSQTQQISLLHSFSFCNIQSPLSWLPCVWGRIWERNNNTRFKLEKCIPIIWGKINPKLAIQRAGVFGTCKRNKAGSDLTETADRAGEEFATW